MQERILDFGLDTFGETMVDGDGRHLSDAETIRVMMDEAVLAESVGIDSYNIGEHYRPDNVDSAGHVILAAIASRTTTLKLGTAVTVLSTQDPVRVYQNFATLDAVSNGRAQLIVGRASATDSFPLFGYNIADYETLFEEKLDLLVRLLRSQPVTWSGATRSALNNQVVKPAIPPGSIPTWVGVGGSPHSVLRAARHGLPLMLAIIGGRPSRFAPFVDLYEKALEQFGQPQLPIGMHAIGHIAASDDEAVAAHWPQYQAVMSKMVEERGFPVPTPAHYEREVTSGALMVGSPETVAQKIVKAVRDLRLSRFDLKHDLGRLSRPDRAESIRLFGTAVIPRVRELLAAEPAATATKEEPAYV